MGADTATQISARPISQEPMVRVLSVWSWCIFKQRPQYILINLGMSENFGTVDLEHVRFFEIVVRAHANF
jgi:hypothetical protein